MRKYRLVAKKGEGTFSEVLKAQNVKDGKYHAIKCMKNRFDSIDQVNNLREIQALRRLSPHEHVISLEEVLYDQPTGRLALVFELMDANLYELIKGRRHYLNPNLIKSYMWQLMKSLDHMHKKGIFHRDIKPENILIESSTEPGRGLKLADFGSCRGIYSKQPYTEYISTRWYRAPECLLTDGYYGPEMDLWGAGCVMFEITSLYPLFPGSNEVDQINRIHKVLGTPTADHIAKFRAKGASHISFDFPPQKGVGIPQLIPHASPDSVDLIVKLLKYDASERITAREAMRHPFFKDVREAEAKQQGENKTAVPAPGATTVPSSGMSVTTVQTQATDAKLQPSQVNSTSKPLPSLVGPSTSTSENSSQQYKNTANTSGHDPQFQQQMMLLKQQSATLKSNAAVSNTTAASTLPPIQTGNLAGSQYKYPDQKSSRGNPSSSINGGTQKRRKKYRLNYAPPSQQQKQKAAQTSEHVMKAYGVPKLIGSIDAGPKGFNSSLDKVDAKINMGMGANAAAPGLVGPGSYGHPSRQYYPAKKI